MSEGESYSIAGRSERVLERDQSQYAGQEGAEGGHDEQGFTHGQGVVVILRKRGGFRVSHGH